MTYMTFAIIQDIRINQIAQRDFDNTKESLESIRKILYLDNLK